MIYCFNDDDNDYILFYYLSCPTSFIGTAYDSLLHTHTVVFTLSTVVSISLFRPQAYLTSYYSLFLSNKITQTCSQSPILRLGWANRLIFLLLFHTSTHICSFLMAYRTAFSYLFVS